MANSPSRRSTRFSMRSKQLGQLLQDNGDVGAEQIAKALKIQEKEGGLIGQILRSLGACDEHAVGAALLKQVQVTDIHCEDLQVGSSVLKTVPAEQCDADKLCPFERLGNLLCVVMGNPLNRRAINTIEEKTRLKVKPFKAPWPKIKELIDRSYTEENLARPDESEPDLNVGDGETGAPEVEALDDAGADVIAPMEIAPPEQIETAEAAPPARAPAARQKAAPALPPEPEIEGLDNLDESNAETIEVDNRGLRRRERKIVSDEPYKMPVREAKINVNLDELDVEATDEVVGSDEDETEESLEEIAPSAARSPAPRKAAAAAPKQAAPKAAAREALVAFEEVDIAFFYKDGVAPPDDVEPDAALLDLVESLPVAEMVADSVEEYKASLEPEPEPEPAKPEKRPLPVEAQPAPADPVKPLVLSEAEFQRLARELDVDPVGEWAWAYAAPGPLEAVTYE